MSIGAEIKGIFNFGGGLTYHTEYQIQVRYHDQSWLIYRRFSDFANLHKHFVALAGGEEQFAAKDIPFPEKSYLGSILSTDKSVTEQRKVELQKFLTSSFEISDYYEDAEVAKFLDVENKGVSGIQREFGADKILKETFCKVKIIKQLFSVVWSLYFVVLLKDGTLYVLQSMYDESSKALMVWSLNNVGVQVIPKAQNNTISISSTAHGQKLKLSLASAMEGAFWIRSLSDFATSTNFQQVASASPPPVTKAPSHLSSGSSKSSAQKMQQQPATVENVYARGTGNTVDELSAEFGI